MRSYFLLFFLLLSSLHSALARQFSESLNKVERPASIEMRTTIYQPEVLTDTISHKFYFGPRLGVNVANLNGDASATVNLVGLLVGLDFGLQLRERVALQVGLAYSKQGAQQDSDSLQTGILQSGLNVSREVEKDSFLLDVGTTVASKYNYLSLPITLKFFPWEENGVYFEAGGRAAFLVKAEIEGFKGSFTDSDAKGASVTQRLNRFDYGMVLGAGYKFKRRLEFGLRFSQSFANHIDRSDPGTVAEGSFRNRLYQATLSYYLTR